MAKQEFDMELIKSARAYCDHKVFNGEVCIKCGKDMWG